MKSIEKGLSPASPFKYTALNFRLDKRTGNRET